MQQPTSTGLTLVELMVTLAIVGGLLALASPRFDQWLVQQRAGANLRALATLVNTARHTALYQRRSVTLCPGDVAGCQTRNSWHQGALVFADANRNLRVDDDEFLIAQQPRFNGGQVIWRSFRNRSFLRFTPQGVTDHQNGHFLYCPNNGDPSGARQVVLNVTGRLYFSRDRSGDGIHEDVQGRPLNCNWLRTRS